MKYLLILFAASVITSCGQQTSTENETIETDLNPASVGFNMEESDTKAIAIADSVMEALGGRKAWDETRCISWNFFGRRDLVWDKSSGDVRIDSPGDSTIYLLNINSMDGAVYKNGAEITDPVDKKSLLERGKSIWINDSYWLVMPFKLKDSGVTLKYIRTDTTLGGIDSHVLQLTFAEVGVTPDNKYEVWVDKQDYLVKQWAYYRDASQDSASAIWPFDNYKQYGNILLSANRSDDRGPKNVKVFTEIEASIFTDPTASLD